MKTLVLTFLAGLLQVPLSSPKGDKKQIRHYFMAALSLLMGCNRMEKPYFCVQKLLSGYPNIMQCQLCY